MCEEHLAASFLSVLRRLNLLFCFGFSSQMLWSSSAPLRPILILGLLVLLLVSLDLASGSSSSSVVLTAPALPLSTKSRYIVDANGQRVKLACVNWSGAHMKDYVVGGLHVSTLDQIASQIAGLGFNCVRLAWSLELYWNNPEVGAEAVTAMPELLGARGLDVYELVKPVSPLI